METLTKNLIQKVPEKVKNILTTLEKGGFEAYLVGGCVRDMIIGREPKDWDITTNAIPEQIMPLFEKTIYENKFGTVGVCVIRDLPAQAGTPEKVSQETPKESEIPTGQAPKYDIIEVTPYRIEGLYSDKRHPDEVKFSQSINDDLKRRDFTINALALGKGSAQNLKDIESGWHLVDLFEGIKDIQNKTIRTVGDAKERFNEDALRLIRAVRFSTELDFVISHETISAIVENSDLIKNISFERIRDEFSKIIMSKYPMTGIGMLSKLKLLQHIIPELEEGIHCEQKGEHIYDVFDHILHALGHAADKNEPLDIRLSALFHDIGKPRTRRWDGTKAGGKGKYTFYGHEVVGARMVKKIMERLKYPGNICQKVEKLVRYHMFFSDTETITLSAVRRVIVNVGPAVASSRKPVDNNNLALAGNENHPIWDLMRVRECDRVGMKKKEAPYRLRKYHAMIEECLRDPISVSQLKIDGTILMNELSIKPGPKMGFILNALLEEVLDDPSKNVREYLDVRVAELNSLSDTELKALGEKAKEKKEELEEKEVLQLHKKHGVNK